jgi:hypothetical protein
MLIALLLKGTTDALRDSCCSLFFDLLLLPGVGGIELNVVLPIDEV